MLGPNDEALAKIVVDRERLLELFQERGIYWIVLQLADLCRERSRILDLEGCPDLSQSHANIAGQLRAMADRALGRIG